MTFKNSFFKIIFQEFFNPEKGKASAKASPSARQNHYANVCALRRKRSSVSNQRAEILASLLRRRATSGDISEVCKARAQEIILRRSNTLIPETDSCTVSLPPSSVNGSPSRGKKVRDLSEFQQLMCKRNCQSQVNPEEERNENLDNSFASSLTSRRCFSESDACSDSNCITEKVPNENDIDCDSVFNSEVDGGTPSKSKNEISSNEDKNNSIKEDYSSNVLSTETTDTDWRVSMSGDSIPSLPPPNELGGGNPLLIFLCVTLLTQQRQFIIQKQMDHNELAMHFDKMIRGHNVRKVLVQARKSFEAYLRADSARSRSSTSSVPSLSSHPSC